MFCKKETLLHQNIARESCVRAYLTKIWNDGQTDQLDLFLHPLFIDFSMPSHPLQNATGVELYLRILNSSVYFCFGIEATASCGDYVYAGLKLHVGPLSSSNPPVTESSQLFSVFRLREQKSFHTGSPNTVKNEHNL
jgi:hypothetical protein